MIRKLGIIGLGIVLGVAAPTALFAQTSPLLKLKPAVGKNAPPATPAEAKPSVGENAPSITPPETNPAVGAAEETKENATPTIVAESTQFRSFFFSNNDLDLMKRAKSIYDRQGLRDNDIYDEEDLLDQLKNIKITDKGLGSPDEPVIVEKYYTQIYLESLVYHKPNDWVVWAQENETSQKLLPTSVASPNASLKIVGTKKEEVIFEWKPLNWQRVAAAYKEDSSDIILDEARKVVVFTLRTNQTLSSYDMTIKEGPLPLIEIVAENKGVGAEIEDILPDIFSEGIEKKVLPEEGADKGIRGLINRGKRIEEMEKR